MNMTINKRSLLSAAAVLTLSMTSLFGCGQKMAGTYSLTQMGAQFSSAQCSQINIAVNESSSTVSGQGSNACFTEMLTGTDNNNGQMTVTLSLMPISGAPGTSMGFTQSGSMMCTYQGTLMVSGNVVTGMLTPMSTYGYGCSGQISLNGTKN
jgi:hypothetical protein